MIPPTRTTTIKVKGTINAAVSVTGVFSLDFSEASTGLYVTPNKSEIPLE